MKILIFGDVPGVTQLVNHVPTEHIIGIVGACIRPQYHEPLLALTNKINVPFVVQPKPHSDTYEIFRTQIERLMPDLIWVNSYSMIIRDDVLALARLGGINIHGALLPRNRGSNPTQWAILNGDYETGVTLHEMTSGLDEGPVIAQKKVPLYFEDTWKMISARIATAADELIAANLPMILSGEWHSNPQQHEKATVGRRRKPEDGQFDWEQPVVHIYNLARALLPPLPPAYYINSDSQKVFLDRYYTPMEIAYLKYGTAGGRKISSDHVSLRPFEQRESSLFYEWITNAKLLISNSPFHLTAENDHEVRVESIITGHTDLVIFVVEELATQRVIGTCQLLNINWRHRSAELQISFDAADPQEEGRDMEAVNLLTRFGFADLNLHRIYLHVFAANARTIRVYEKCGFAREGLLKDASFIDGRWVDVVVMGKLSDDR